MAEAFGKDVYLDGVLDRRALASIVFADHEKLQTLNSIVHPLVKASVFLGGPLLRADFTDDPGCDNLGVVAELHLKADF